MNEPRAAPRPAARTVCLGLLLATIGGAPQAHAAPGRGLLHRCKGGETYGALADRYYGKRYLQRHLRQLNRYPEPLKPGHQVIIPTLRRVVVSEAQTLEAFAREHLQDEERAPYLRLLNGLEGSTLAKGARVLVPSNSLKHLVRPGETFASIAQTYYRDQDRRRRRLLQLYNKLPPGPLTPMLDLRIPLDTPLFAAARVRARAARPAAPPPPPPPAATRTRPPSRKKRAAPVKPAAPAKPAPVSAAARKAVDDAIEQAERHLSDGAFTRALAVANATLAAYDQTRVSRKVELLRIKGTALVALAKPGEAKRAFESLLRLDPAYRLDLYSTSPKVLDVFHSISARWD